MPEVRNPIKLHDSIRQDMARAQTGQTKTQLIIITGVQNNVAGAKRVVFCLKEQHSSRAEGRFGADERRERHTEGGVEEECGASGRG